MASTGYHIWEGSSRENVRLMMKREDNLMQRARRRLRYSEPFPETSFLRPQKPPYKVTKFAEGMNYSQERKRDCLVRDHLH